MPAWCIARQPKAKTVAKKRANDEGTPTNKAYFLAGTKATADTLKRISGVVPVPMVSELLELAIRVVEACEDATAIEEHVEELRKRIVSLSVLIVDKVPSDHKISDDLRTRIENLQSILSRIEQDLNEIKRQWRLLLIVFPQLNKERVERCLGNLDVALEAFNISHQLQVEEVLEKILQKHNEINDGVNEINVNVAALTKKVDSIIENLKPHSSPYTVGRQDTPSLPKVFYGRDGDVSTIVSLLSRKDTSRVCITGSGGMGKTRVALALIHNPTIYQIFGDYRFWVPCIKATSAEGLRRIFYAQLSITAQTYDGLDILINELKATEDRRLIVLDNFETPWDSSDEAEISDILSRIAELPHVALLVTMTSSFPPNSDILWNHHHLLALDDSAARKAFLAEYPSADLTEVDELTRAVGHIPLAIYLMACNGRESETSAKDLLHEWKSTGTEMVDRLDLRIKKSIDLVRVEDSNGEALRLLAILSMLPLGTTRENISSIWAADLGSISRALALLRNKALVEHENRESGDLSRIYVIPTIQVYMDRHQLVTMEVQRRVQNSCQQFVLKHKPSIAGADDHHFKEHLSALSREENNIQILLMQDNNSTESLHADALVAFSIYLAETKPSIVTANLALKIAETGQKHRCIAEAHEVLGRMYSTVDKDEEACHHFEEAHQHFIDLPTGPDLARAGECSFQLAEVWRYLGKSSQVEMESLVEQAREELCHDKDNEYNIARSLLGFGHYLWYSEQRSEARKILTAAKDEFERLDCLASASCSLYRLARIEAQDGNYPLALKLSQQALATAEQSGDDEIICLSLETQARCLITLKCYEEAEHILQRDLSFVRGLGSILGVAAVLELLGYIYSQRGYLDKAIQLYTEAQIQYNKIQSPTMGHHTKLRCKRNIQTLASGQPDHIEKPMLY